MEVSCRQSRDAQQIQQIRNEYKLFLKQIQVRDSEIGHFTCCQPHPPQKKNTEIYLGELAEVLYYVVQIILQLLNY